MPALPHVVRLDLAVSVGALVEIGRESVLLSVKREHARIVPAELIGAQFKAYFVFPDGTTVG